MCRLLHCYSGAMKKRKRVCSATKVSGGEKSGCGCHHTVLLLNLDLQMQSDVGYLKQKMSGKLAECNDIATTCYNCGIEF